MEFASKADLLTWIDSQSLARVSLGLVESLTAADGKTIDKYDISVLEQDSQSGKVTNRNLGFYVVDEGLAGEKAYFRDQVRQKDVVRSVAQTYLDTLIPATFLKGQITTVNEEHAYAIARVFEVVGADATEKEIVIYKPSGQPVEHKNFIRL